MPFVYILRCSDNSFYVGHPVKLVYSELFDSLAAAVKREKQLKHWSAQKKEALIKGDLRALKQLSKRRKN